MIAAHLEPKGLEPSAIPLTTHEPEERLKRAITGSDKLRDAILTAKGYIVQQPEVVAPLPLPPPPKFKPRKCRRGRPKGSHKIRQPNATIAHIQALIATHFKLTVDQLVNGGKNYKFARPRQVAMYAARKATTASYPDIAFQFGGRDHTTVLHAFWQIEKRLAANDSETIKALIAVHAGIGE